MSADTAAEGAMQAESPALELRLLRCVDLTHLKRHASYKHGSARLRRRVGTPTVPLVSAAGLVRG